MNLLDTIRGLSDLCGVSGDEHAVRDAIIARIDGRHDYTVDPLGNLLVRKKGAATPKNVILFSAHMDEVGFIVTHIEDSGLLRFATVGGIDSRVIPGRAVEVGPNRIYGVIGAKALHHAEAKEREEPIKPDKLFIDIGAENREQAAALVSIGDRAVFYAAYQQLGDKILGRAFDDRAGCGLLLHMLEADLPYDCHFSFTVQEETGCTGGITAGYTVRPDIAVIVETTTASDIAGVEPGKVVCKLGNGPVLSFMDRGAIYDMGLYRSAMELAKSEGIPVQAKEGVYGGNEARSIQSAGSGARTLAVSLPCRYLHSPSNMLQRSDIDNTFRLLCGLADAFGTL